MGHVIFNVRRPDGKVAAQTLAREHAEREVRWNLASGFPGPFTIEPIEREASSPGYSVPRISGGIWPPAKLIEFGARYLRGDPIFELSEYYGTSVNVIIKMARKLGFGYRRDDPRRFEMHRGKWTDREEELINHMYDTEIPVSQISGAIPRTVKAIEARLGATASDRSERSKFGRFIVKGRRGIRPVLETPSGSDEHK